METSTVREMVPSWFWEFHKQRSSAETSLNRYNQFLSGIGTAINNTIGLQSFVNELNIKIAAPKLDEFADAMNSAVLTVGDIVKKIGKLKYEFPTPKLDKFAHA